MGVQTARQAKLLEGRWCGRHDGAKIGHAGMLVYQRAHREPDRVVGGLHRADRRPGSRHLLGIVKRILRPDADFRLVGIGDANGFRGVDPDILADDRNRASFSSVI